MPDNDRTQTMAVFCDFENIAIGTREAKYDKVDINKVLERLLVKGHIVVKKAYCDWSRYEMFKKPMHEAAFELIEIPHVRQSGKNSADIRMVVDALDLCYTKPHMDTFVIISGDSDFSPLVSKLRENNKTVIGLGVKNSTSDLFIANCDEFIFYDDLVRQQRKRVAARKPVAPAPQKTDPAEGKASGDPDAAIQLVMEVVDILSEERGDDGKIWGSMIKQALKRKQPGFSERYHGFRSFRALLEAARDRGLVELKLDEKSDDYSVKNVAEQNA